MDLREESAVDLDPEAHWYYRSKGRAIRQFLGAYSAQAVLDVGAGSGIFVRQLIKNGRCRRATCIDPNYAEDHSEQVAGGRIEFLRGGGYGGEDCVLFVDVLEHVRDDVGLLRQYTADLKPGAVALITVPAFPFLWSGHDEFLKHERRYSLSQLERCVRQAELSIEKSRFFFATIFPLAAAARLADRHPLRRVSKEPQSSLRPHGRLVNATLTGLLDLERVTLFRCNRLLGLTIFCLARRD